MELDKAAIFSDQNCIDFGYIGENKEEEQDQKTGVFCFKFTIDSLLTITTVNVNLV